ncbi:uncharacterized protein LOC113352267 [Papaver somniferum]|uniref:uncharacterized protein LOC113352267 n=1 Tax=Papaver somniferum TaxID=3469 RepID=UPI000E7060E4|nr:uncharacterized protein LOC113352267 [Papaver somniferum]
MLDLLVKQVWICASCIILKELWFQKNKRFFEDIKPNMQRFKCRVLKLVHETGLRIKGTKWCQNYDQQIITAFDLGIRHSKFQIIKKCCWIPPELGVVMFCYDGSSFGNPGSAGFGVVARDSNCQVIGTLTGGIGVATNYLAETYGVMNSLELAVEWKLQDIIIVSDSKTVLAEFAQGKIPWFLKGRWKIEQGKVSRIRYHHCYREVNFSANGIAKKGASLAAGVRLLHIGRPPYLPRIEMPDVDYFRFF